MALIIHTISEAPRAWRVLMGMALKGLPWEQPLLEASEGEHKSKPLLTLNPRGTVPVLESEGIIVCQRTAIRIWA